MKNQTTLDICKSLFDALNSQGITYCHWKSNSHLDKALAGKTDIDILVHDKDKNIFEKVLDELSIKKILSPLEKQFPGLEDYLGFDNSTGNFIHLHVHYRLVLGQRHIKNHHLPIEGILFQNLTVKNNVNIPCPEVELLLLIIRANMKVDMLSLVKHGIKDLISEGYTAFPADIEDELRGLINVSSIEKMKKLLEQTKLPVSETLFTRFIDKFTSQKLKFHDVLRTQWRLFSDLKDYRRNKGIGIYLKYGGFVVREWPYIRNLAKSKGKTLPGGGKVFSIIGADGSGKSTLIEDLNKWLSWKMAAKKYYHGIPKTKVIKLLDFANRGFTKFKLEFVADLIRYYIWTYIAKNRVRISVVSRKNSDNGEIVITDRFPLKAFHDMREPMDGPRLMEESNRIGRFYSTLERSYYDRILLPDYIFVLQASIEELRKRKRDLDLTTHKAKAAAVNAVEGSETCILIDANKPYSDVQLEIKRKIWEYL